MSINCSSFLILHDVVDGVCQDKIRFQKKDIIDTGKKGSDAILALIRNPSYEVVLMKADLADILRKKGLMVNK